MAIYDMPKKWTKRVRNRTESLYDWRFPGPQILLKRPKMEKRPPAGHINGRGTVEDWTGFLPWLVRLGIIQFWLIP